MISSNSNRINNKMKSGLRKKLVVVGLTLASLIGLGNVALDSFEEAKTKREEKERQEYLAQCDSTLTGSDFSRLLSALPDLPHEFRSQDFDVEIDPEIRENGDIFYGLSIDDGRRPGRYKIAYELQVTDRFPSGPSIGDKITGGILSMEYHGNNWGRPCPCPNGEWKVDGLSENRNGRICQEIVEGEYGNPELRDCATGSKYVYPHWHSTQLGRVPIFLEEGPKRKFYAALNHIMDLEVIARQ